MPGRAKTPEERQRKREAAIAAGLTRATPDVPLSARAERVGPGNDLALSHGAYVPAIVNPIAARKLAWMLGPDWPEHVKAPHLRPLLSELAVTEARIELLDAEIDGLGIEDAISELTTTVEKLTGSMEEGTFRRRAKSKKRGSPLEARRREGAHRLNLLKELGVTPLARAKLGKDVSSTAVNMAQIWSEEGE